MRIESVKEERNIISEDFCKKAEKRSMLMGKAKKMVASIVGVFISGGVANSSVHAAERAVKEVVNGVETPYAGEATCVSITIIGYVSIFGRILSAAISVIFFILTLINLLKLKFAKKSKTKNENEEINKRIKKYKKRLKIFLIIIIVAILACVGFHILYNFFGTEIC